MIDLLIIGGGQSRICGSRACWSPWTSGCFVWKKINGWRLSQWRMYPDQNPRYTVPKRMKMHYTEINTVCMVKYLLWFGKIMVVKIKLYESLSPEWKVKWREQRNGHWRGSPDTGSKRKGTEVTCNGESYLAKTCWYVPIWSICSRSGLAEKPEIPSSPIAKFWIWKNCHNHYCYWRWR